MDYQQRKAELFERARYDRRAAFALDDLLRAEEAQEAERRAYAPRNDDAGSLIYRTTETRPAPAAQATPTPFDGDYPPLDQLIDGIARATMTLLRKRDQRIAKLEAQVELLTALLSKSDKLSNVKAADIIDVPDWRKRA
jgi:hypothetical protein